MGLKIQGVHRKQHIITRIKDIAAPLIDPAFVREKTEETLQRHNDPNLFPIFSADHTLSSGFPGLCLLFHELSVLDQHENWTLAAHQHFAFFNQQVREKKLKLPLSLWTGVTGIGLTALAISEGGQHYQGFMTSINRQITALLPGVIQQAIKNLEQGVQVTDYDTVRGLTGIGRYLLFFKDRPLCLEGLKEILAYFVKLTEEKRVGQRSIPGWYVPTNETKEMYPNGFFDVGLSHGICGPLSLLSLCSTRGITVEGQEDAIKRIVNWLEEWTFSDAQGCSYWPEIVSFEEQIQQQEERKPRANQVNYSWCYGFPAIARALWLAGQALSDAALQKQALVSFQRLIELEQNALASPTVCHGYAGLLQIVTRMYEDSQEAFLAQVQEELIDRILEQYNQKLNFGFYTVEGTEAARAYLDLPGLLNGFAGVALALLSSVQGSTFEWDAALLIK